MSYAIDTECNILNASVYKDYSCALNQSNIENNNNKFYIIQIITTGTNFYLWTRYGRVGERGNTVPKSYYAKDYEAIHDFCATFHKKTGNKWQHRNKFIPQSRKYVMIDIEAPMKVIDVADSSKVVTPTPLDGRLTRLIEMIGSKEVMLSTLKTLNIDTKRMPLGKISKTQISKGQDILSLIYGYMSDNVIPNLKAFGIENIEQFRKNMITDLSSAFWSNIPFSCGRMAPPRIDTKEKLEQYADLLQVITNIEVAAKLIEKKTTVDDVYSSLNATITPVESDSVTWKHLQDYIHGTHAPTHDYDLELVQAYKISKSEPSDVTKYFESISDHRLLIHGSKMANFIGIFTNGFRIPLPNQVSNGAVLGRGIYFADSISKSFNYCNCQETNNTGIIVLCEVALGNRETVNYPSYSNLKSSYNSRVARGRSGPFEFIQWATSNIKIPAGPIIDFGTQSSFLYNEYVIFDKRQYRFSYILQLKRMDRKK
jgi:poly [ADP-ribose] polymerase